MSLRVKIIASGNPAKRRFSTTDIFRPKRIYSLVLEQFLQSVEFESSETKVKRRFARKLSLVENRRKLTRAACSYFNGNGRGWR